MFRVNKYSILFLFWYYFTSTIATQLSDKLIELNITTAVGTGQVEKSKYFNDIYMEEEKYRIFMYVPEEKSKSQDPKHMLIGFI